MTGKRFIIMDNLPKGTHSNIWDKQKQHNQGIGDELWLGEVVAMLNEGVTLAEENQALKERRHEDINELAVIAIKYNALKEENKELQERNDRQYKQLGDLYRLIEQKDWRALSDIMDDFKKAEEQLQKEWSEYND
jgi:DNA-binding transcriptional MerR regulator